jgi:ADP-ribosylglycohydrolase
MASRLHDALLALAKISYLYSSDGGTTEEILDVDDYIQTVLIGESLVANRGFNHRDLVRRYRTKPGHIIDGREVAASGISAWYKGQVKKLIDSRDLDFMAHDGITSGSAMKVACIAAFYAHDMGALCANTDLITRITHASTDARLAALLTVLRYHQIFVGQENSTAGLREALMDAKKRLNIHGGEFFLELFDAGAALVDSCDEPTQLLVELNRVIGLSHVATSVPISACLWTFRPIDPCEVLENWTLFNHSDVYTGKVVIPHSDWYYAPHRQHFIDLGYTADDSRLLGDERRSHFDLDTLFSIAFSMLAAQKGLGRMIRNNELDEFTDNLDVLARNLVELGALERF